MVYLDDLIVVGRTWSDHLTNLRLVFDRLKKAGLKAKPSKCRFGCRKVKYLGHIVSPEGVECDTDKTTAIAQYPRPHDLHSLRAWLGSVGYYRKHIRNFSHIVSPLTELTKKGKPFVWTNECENAFCELKRTLTEPPILLAYPDYNAPYVLFYDSSATAVGYVLSQMQNNIERVIAYGGRALNKHERNLSTTHREALACISGLRHFDHYIRHSHVDIVTDHSALKSLLSIKEPTGKLARWIAMLQSYSYDIKIRPGRVHGNCDGLSRRDCPPTNENESDYFPQLYAIKRSTNIQKTNTQTPVMLTQEIKGDTIEQSDQSEQINLPELPPAFTKQKLIDMQSTDNLLKPIIDHLKYGWTPDDQKQAAKLYTKAANFIIIDSILYHVWILSGKGHKRDRTLSQLVVPDTLVPEILHHTHEDLGAHRGITKMINILKLNYYWEAMCNGIIHYVKTCQACERRKRPIKPIKSPLEPIRASRAMQILCIDTLGPLNITDSGNRHIVVISGVARI